MLTPAIGDEHGLGVAEVLLASSLVLLAALSCTRVTVGAVAAQGRAAARERATIATDDAIEIVRSGGCLFLTGAEARDDASAVADRCRAGLALPPEAAVGGGVGRVDAGGLPLEVHLSSRWVGAAAPPDPIGCSSGYYAGRPVAVERRVVVRYREAGRLRDRPEAVAVEAAPTDRYTLRSWQRSNLVVASTPGAAGELTGPSGVGVSRAADPNGCIWFPALLSATYVLRVTTASGSTSTATIAFTATPRTGAPTVVQR